MISAKRLNEKLKEALEYETKAAQSTIHKRNIIIARLREDFCLLVSEIARLHYEDRKKDSYIKTLETVKETRPI